MKEVNECFYNERKIFVVIEKEFGILQLCKNLINRKYYLKSKFSNYIPIELNSKEELFLLNKKDKSMLFLDLHIEELDMILRKGTIKERNYSILSESYIFALSEKEALLEYLKN
jgi:hypothetical protein